MGLPECTALLLERNANVDATTPVGWLFGCVLVRHFDWLQFHETCLHLAAVSGDESVCERILAHAPHLLQKVDKVC